jgi:hydroxypyruvate isomerase
MPNLAANLTMMFNEVEFLQRFDAAADAGFKGVEALFPYGYDKNQLSDILNNRNLEFVLHNLPPGDWDAGERGIACIPDRVGEFQGGVETAIEYATILNCKQLNCLSGIAPKSANKDIVTETFISNLKFAADALQNKGIRLLIEPINTMDIPGIFLNNTSQALEIMEIVGSNNLWLQYDIYHMQIMEGDITRSIEKHFEMIKHMQLADNPGRHEPGTGEINYPFVFNAIDQMGYDGWIGCEYKPKNDTIQGLGWTLNYL